MFGLPPPNYNHLIPKFCLEHSMIMQDTPLVYSVGLSIVSYPT